MEEREESRAQGRRRRRREPLGDRYEAALELAFSQLASRARSEAEIRRRLARAGASEPTVERVIVRLWELRYLDDEAFARARTRSLARRGYGPGAISRKLALAGVRPEIAREGVREEIGAEEGGLARAALERRLRGRPFATLDPKEQARLLRWLASRGFSPSAIRKACGPAGSFDPDPADV